MRARDYRMLFCVLMFFGSVDRAQPRSETEPLKTTMCDLYKDPQMYAGKVIEVRATIVGYRAPEITQPAFLPQEPCLASGYMRIALELPQNVQPKPAFDLVSDESFQKYQAALQKPMRVEATLEGRFDPAFIWENHKRVRIGEGKGYGKNHSADGRLVLRKMSDVSTRYMPRR